MRLAVRSEIKSVPQRLKEMRPAWDLYAFGQGMLRRSANGLGISSLGTRKFFWHGQRVYEFRK